MVLPACFDHVEEHFSYQEVQFKTIYPPVKTSCPAAEIVKETTAFAIAKT